MDSTRDEKAGQHDNPHHAICRRRGNGEGVNVLELKGALVILHLRDSNEEMVSAWRGAFDGVADVQISHGDFFDVQADAVVSPANSFGFMDGGIDRVYIQRFGCALQERVQQEIQDRFFGELPVGQAFIVPTLDDQTPFLVCAPTMRVPLSVQFSANAYLALRAALLCVMRHSNDDKPNIETLLCPGLATGVGCLPVQVAAKQMRAAFENAVHGQKRVFTTMGDAYAEHVSLVSRSPFVPATDKESF